MKYGWLFGAVALTLVGCEVPGPKVTLQDGSVIQVTKTEKKSAVMVKGNPSAARLSERSDRKVVPYTLTCADTKGLELTLEESGTAIEDGSYSRYVMTLTNTTEAPIAIDRIYALDNYDCDGVKGTLVKSGNTDGAVMVLYPENESGTCLWFAIEHPMARYEWVNASSQEVPEKKTYAIADLRTSTGYFLVPVKTTEASVRVTLSYTGGNLKGIYSKVELLDPETQEVLCVDAHAGESGTVSKNNVYTLMNGVSGKDAVLRIWAKTDGTADTDTSNGTITLEGAKHIRALTLTQGLSLTAYVPVNDTLASGATMSLSAVVGRCDDTAQFRRVFNAYLNAERAHPHRMLPHYNSWYDLGINRNDRGVEGRFTEQEALDSMRAFREELYEKRGVFINSYLWDDGWDEWDSLWGFNANFPEGFKNLAAEAHKVSGASIACWMSPFGGYGGSFGRRLNYAKKNKIIDADAHGLQLSRPIYYAAFRDRVLSMIENYDMNLFKFDRMGSGQDANGAGERYAADLRAVGQLCSEMRAAKQDVFINCTVGTWASPYWLMWCDSIWKGDGDCDWLGEVGTPRQKWVTYRDNIIYDRFVSKAPLFPLNSLMMHGILVCKSSPHNTMTDYRGTGHYMYDGEGYATPTACADFAAEVWMGVALGTGLQEYYITPKLMSKVWWDILADGVKWLKENETVLTDAHWIGGDPADGHDMQKRGNAPKDVYGYASLGEKKGIVILRNPSNLPQTVTVDMDGWLEMPKARQGMRYTPVVVFNSTDAYENKGSPEAFTPVWPATTADKVEWTLPPFTTFLMEVRFE